METSTLFKWRHFQAKILLLCVRWYLRYPQSNRDLKEMMLERGLHVDHTTVDRCVIDMHQNWRSAHELLKRANASSRERLMRRRSG
jgi:transposase-like protein